MFSAESASENFLQSVNIWQSHKKEGGCLVHVVRLATTLLKVEEIIFTFLPLTMPNIHRFKNKSLADSAVTFRNLVIENPTSP